MINQLFKDIFYIFIMLTFVTAIGSVIDGMIIGKYLGSAAIAAYGLTVPFQKFTAIFPNVLSMGMQLLVSRKLGRGELDAANGDFTLSMIFGTGLAIFFIAAVYIFPAGVADILGAEESLGIIRVGAIDYLQSYSLGLPAIAAIALLTPIMQLDSDRARTVYAVIALSVTSILGDLAVVFYFGGDLWMIGMATAIAYYVSAGCLLMHFLKADAAFRFSTANIKISNLREMFLEGSPIGIGRGALMLCGRFLNSVALATGGGVAVAAVAIWINIYSMVTAFPKALASSVQIISGVLISEQDKKSVVKLIKFATKYSMAVVVAVAAILFLAAPQFASLYTNSGDTEIFELAVEGIRALALSSIFIMLSAPVQYFYQAYGRFKLVNWMAVANNFLLIVPAALILTPYFSITGIWAADVVNQVVFLGLIILGVWIHSREITFAPENILLLPKDFGDNPQLNMTVTFKDDDLSISEVVEVFLEKHNISRKKTMYAAICVEEIVNNILEHGFSDGKKHSIDVRVIIHNEEITIRIRDDCRAFNPKKWQEIYNDADPTAHIGIKLVSKMAKEFQYINVLKLNNLIIKI